MNTSSFESLEFLFSKDRKKYSVIGFPGSPCTGFTQGNYPRKNILQVSVPKIESFSEMKKFAIWGDPKKMLDNSDLNALLKKNAVDSLMPDTYSSAFLEKWAKEKKVDLIVTPIKLQKKIENKIFFDKFLNKYKLPVPKSRILRSTKDLEKINFFPVIVQVPNSIGSEGTFLMKSENEIMRLITTHKNVKFPLLCREFIGDSLPLGISIIIGPKKMIFSGIRVQAFFSQPNGKSIYYGIQWIKTSFFKPKVIEKMNVALKKAGEELQKIGFRGIAAFDLMFRGEDIYFIECNPRTGGSTPQISLRPELFHGLTLTEEFIRATTGKELTAHKPFIPDSKYEGFTLDLGFAMDIYPMGSKLNKLQNGIFKFKNGKFQFDSFKVEALKNKDSIFLYYVRPEKAVLTNKNFMGFLMTHFPLLEIKKDRYNFSAGAKKLLEHIRKIMIQNGKNI